MRLIDRRLGLLFCGFFLLFSLVVLRAFWLQGVQGGTLRAEARSQQVTTVTIPGERGRVLDRNGKVLAASEDAADVVATPYQVENPGRTAVQLHDVLASRPPTCSSPSPIAAPASPISPGRSIRTSPPRSRSSTSLASPPSRPAGASTRRASSPRR